MLNHTGPILLRATAGAMFGAMVAAVPLFTRSSWWPFLPTLATELPLWLLAMALTVFPVTVLSAASTRVLLERLGGPPIITAAAIAATLMVISPFAFGWYMTEAVPAVNWWRAWWVPAAASASTVLIEVTAFRPGRRRPSPHVNSQA